MNRTTGTTYTDFLLDVHAANPGLTERSIGCARTIDGRSSYEVFCSFVDPQPGMVVVDLACGNGPLCMLLSQCVGRQGRVIGVDQSDAELMAAEQRLRACSNVCLLRGPAEQMPLERSSADLVVCHLAFMLFPALSRVVHEIERVLNVGGRFAAVVPTLRVPTDLFCACSEILRTALIDAKCAGDTLRGNAVRMNSVLDIKDIFSEGHWLCDEIQTLDIDVSVVARAEMLAEIIVPAFYHYHLLPDESQCRVKHLWTEHFKQCMAPEGTTRFTFPLSAFMVKKGV